MPAPQPKAQIEHYGAERQQALSVQRAQAVLREQPNELKARWVCVMPTQIVRKRPLPVSHITAAMPVKTVPFLDPYLKWASMMMPCPVLAASSNQKHQNETSSRRCLTQLRLESLIRVAALQLELLAGLTPLDHLH
jgi:hypothetical protein